MRAYQFAVTLMLKDGGIIDTKEVEYEICKILEEAVS